MHRRENMQILGLELADVIFASMLVPYPTDLSVREHEQPSDVYPSPLFCHLTSSHDFEESLTFFYIFLKIR
jgi:hypothetical protein